MSEEAWREAVMELYGPSGYAEVQKIAARIRDEKGFRNGEKKRT